MAWKKIVQRAGVAACPKCGNNGFDLEPWEKIDDPNAQVRCGECGYVCGGGEFMRAVHPEHRQETWPVRQTIELPDDKRKLVLFDSSAHLGGRLENLVLLDPAGMFVWAAELPEGTSPDCFVGARIDAGTLLANTWSGYLVTLDPQTGRILAQRFVK